MTNDSFVASQIEIFVQELDALLCSNEYVNALSLLEEAWPQISNHLDARTSCIAARVLIRNGHFEFANRLMEEQVLLHPNNPEVIRWWVQAIADTRHDYRTSVRGEVAVAAPVHVSTIEHAAESHIRLGNHDRAREILNRNRGKLQVRGHRLRMHDAFYNLNDSHKVLDVIKEMPENISSRSEFAAHHALSIFQIGDVNASLVVLEKLVSEGCINACITKYEIFRKCGRNEEAFDAANYALTFHGFAPLSKGWMESGFKLTHLGCDSLIESKDDRLVSVIMTAHKINPMMETAVKSILDQTHIKLELLIIDDCSPEKDVLEYHKMVESDQRIRVISQAVNSGTYAGRNRGIQESKGEFITFIDSDDWQHPQKIEKALNRLDDNQDSIATLESYIRLDPEGHVATVGSWFARKSLMCMTWRTDVLRDELGGFDEVRVSADSELLERAEICFGKSRIVHAPYWVYVATHHDDSLTGGGPFEIGWLGIHGPRASYVSQFRAWHSRMRSNPDRLKLDSGSKLGRFPVPEIMPRASAKLDYVDDSNNHIPNIVSDITEMALNPFELEEKNVEIDTSSIIVCMATYPTRFQIIGKTVESLLNQTLPCNRILIHVNESDEPPPLPDDSRVEVYCSPDENLTDIGKFKMASFVDSGIVITVDDDILYPPDYIESIVAALSRTGGQAIVGFHGAVLPIGTPIQSWEEYQQERRVHWFRRGLQCDLPVQIVGTGTMGYCVDTISFDWESFDYLKMVDLHVAVAAQKAGVPIVTSIRRDEWLVDIEEEEESGEAIWEIVQQDIGLQNRMIEVINRVDEWSLHLLDNQSCKISNLRLAREVREPEINTEITNEGISYNVNSRWRCVGSRLFFDTGGGEVFFDMPEDWSLEATHEDLFRVAHYVMMSPWEKDILEDWVPTRKPGWRPGLAFSGGMDSVAAMLLMPQDTILIYNRREGFKTILNHTNVEHLIQHLEEEHGRTVVVVPSSHESIRVQYGMSSGFSTDYACGVQVILLADYFGLDSIGTGMPLENSYLFHGHKYRDFESSWFWRHHSELFSKIGLDIYQPVAGCSEIINMRIVQDNELEHHAQSCLRSDEPGVSCGACWKCFRKNSLLGHPIEMSNEILTFLKKRPLKQAASTLYSIRKNDGFKEMIDAHEDIPDMEELLETPLDFLEYHHEPALSLIPLRYRRFTRTRLQRYAEPMADEMVEQFRSLDMFDSVV